ncbi:MAG: hypothetical protein GY765_11045 [bacterium]|nr:hypothetical protein [bacterium]
MFDNQLASANIENCSKVFKELLDHLPQSTGEPVQWNPELRRKADSASKALRHLESLFDLSEKQETKGLFVPCPRKYFPM